MDSFECLLTIVVPNWKGFVFVCPSMYAGRLRTDAVAGQRQSLSVEHRPMGSVA